MRAMWIEPLSNGLEIEEGQTGGDEVWEDDAFRKSAVLGPDGEPLRLVRKRRRIGFDLRMQGRDE